MKKIKHSAILAFTLFMAGLGATAQNVGIGTATPDASAQLDITAPNKGLLIPRVALTGLTDAVTITAPANSLLVYNTNGAVPGGVGFYYNSGSGSALWVKLLSGVGGGSGWGLTGNAATDSTLNFIGTTDLKPLVFRVNNGFAGQLGSNGGISFGRGANALRKFTDAGIIAIGDSALFNNVDSNVIAVGNGALYNNTTGSNNTAFGNLSLFGNQNANNNTGIGFAALAFTQTDRNTAVGSLSLANNTAGVENSAVGYGAMNLNDNGYYNTAIGTLALLNNTTADDNTAIGSYSLYSNTTGMRNTALGTEALATLVSGNYNTAIGDSADVTSATLFNTTALGFQAKATASNSVRIGNSQVTSIGGAVDWQVLSDGRYKKAVSEDVKGLDFIMQLRPVTYQYDFEKVRAEKYVTKASAIAATNNTLHSRFINSGKFDVKKISNRNFSLDRTKNSLNRGALTPLNPELAKYYEEVKQNDQVRYTGFIAQEVEAAASKIGFNFSGVNKPKNDQDQYALRYASFVVPLVKAVQEQQAIINSQNKKIDDLIKRIETLEAAKL